MRFVSRMLAIALASRSWKTWSATFQCDQTCSSTGRLLSNFALGAVTDEA